MNSNVKNSILATLVADALALKSHWVYDEEQLQTIDFTTFGNPLAEYHKHKAGEFTHYGDQLFITLKSIVQQSTFNTEEFAKEWKALFKNYDDYYDHATKETIESLENGILPPGSSSADGSVIGRIAPLLLVANDKEHFLQLTAEYIAFTHNHPDVILIGEYFANALWEITQGKSIEEALQTTDAQITEWIDKSKETLPKSCDVHNIIGTVIHVLEQHKSLEESIPLALSIGGDNSARAMIVAMLLAAKGDEIPQKWIDGLKQKEDILSLLEL